ncbi:MAG: histidinol-phosphate transaminase [Alphaproteobacteria bacterium]
MAGKTQRLDAYMPDIGISVVTKVVGDGESGPLTDLSLNESSYGASPKALAAAAERGALLNRYPDPASKALRAAIANAYGLDPEHLVCGNGSEELIDVIARLFARTGDEVLFSERSFMQFPIVARRVGATEVTAPERDLIPQVDEMLARITEKTKIVFLANPNNPSGTYMPKDELHRLCAGIPPHIVFVIDSAYADFAHTVADYSDGHELVEGRENVIVTRTFSKAFGLAALRVGWAHGSARIIGFMNRMRGIGNVNALAQEAATAALGDLDFVRDVARRTAEERARVTKALEAIGLAVVPSVTNFLLVRFPTGTNHNAASALSHLAEQGIIVRAVDDYGLGEYLRITLGNRDENDAVIARMKRFMV